MTITLRPANEVDFQDYLVAFNLAYDDYFVPLQMQRDPMLRLIERDAIDMNASKAVIDDGQIVGVGMLAIQNNIGWIGGVGVIPAYRGKSIGRLITTVLLVEARIRNLAYVQLEVIEENVTAVNLYASLGFQPTRRLLILSRQPQPSQPTPREHIAIEEVHARDAIRYYHDFHPRANPWQRRYHALDFLKDNFDSWVARRDQQTIAYVVGWLLPDATHLMDIAGEEAGVSALLDYLHDFAPANTVDISNLDENDPVWAVMQDKGYEVKLSQFEMVIQTDSAT
jgi:ribosomal protein S18 acetylase RimI-like enzyme